MFSSRLSKQIIAVTLCLGAAPSLAHAARPNSPAKQRAASGLSAAKVFHPLNYRNAPRRFSQKQLKRYQKTKVTIGARLFGINGDNLGRRAKMVFGTRAARFEAYPVYINGKAINQAQLVAHSGTGISNQQQAATIKTVIPGQHKSVTANTTRGFYGSSMRTNANRLLIVTERGAKISGLKNLAIERKGTNGDQQMILLSKRIPQRWARNAEGVLYTESAAGSKLKTGLVVTSSDGRRSTKVRAVFPDTGISSAAVPPGVRSWREANQLMSRSRSEQVAMPK